MKRYVIGLDIGTSSVKGALICEDGTTVATARREFVYSHPSEKAIEIDAEKYIETVYSALAELKAAMPRCTKLVGICEASASGNTVLVGKDGRATTPIYNWQDERVTDEAEKLFPNLDTEALYRKVGWGFDFKTFPIALLSYIKVHTPQLLDEAMMVTMSTEYLNYRLTGGWGITTSAGTPYYLLNQVTGEYNHEIIDVLGVGEDRLPPIVDVGTVIGTVTKEANKATGIPVGTPVMAGTFDHPSAARGVGVLKEGQMLLSCGTSWVGFFPLEGNDRLTANHMMRDPFLSFKGGCWAGLTSVASISNKIDEYVRRYIQDGSDRYAAFAYNAGLSKSGANGLKLTFTPEDDKLAENFSKPDISRAIMEGVIEKLAADVESIRKAGVNPKNAVMVGGPSENPVWKDVIEEYTGLTLEIKRGAYAGATGAAIVAGISAGIFENEESAAALMK